MLGVWDTQYNEFVVKTMQGAAPVLILANRACRPPVETPGTVLASTPVSICATAVLPIAGTVHAVPGNRQSRYSWSSAQSSGCSCNACSYKSAAADRSPLASRSAASVSLRSAVREIDLPRLPRRAASAASYLPCDVPGHKKSAAGTTSRQPCLARPGELPEHRARGATTPGLMHMCTKLTGWRLAALSVCWPWIFARLQQGCCVCVQETLSDRQAHSATTTSKQKQCHADMRMSACPPTAYLCL